VKKLSKGMQCYNCDNCNKEFFRFKSQVRGKTKSCSKECSSKALASSGILTGENNPNYRHGKHCIESLCQCGNEKDYRATKCAICSHKGFPKRVEYGTNDSDILEASKSLTSYIEIAEGLGVSRQRVSEVLKENNVDISHFVACRDRPSSFENVFKLRTSGKRSQLPRQHILRYELIDYRCSGCGIFDEWNGSPIVLELDHINGNSLDDRFENLRILCPNCHSQTTTYRGRNATKLKRNARSSSTS